MLHKQVHIQYIYHIVKPPTPPSLSPIHACTHTHTYVDPPTFLHIRDSFVFQVVKEHHRKSWASTVHQVLCQQLQGPLWPPASQHPAHHEGPQVKIKCHNFHLHLQNSNIIISEIKDWCWQMRRIYQRIADVVRFSFSFTAFYLIDCLSKWCHWSSPSSILDLSIDKEEQLVNLTLLPEDTGKSDILPESLGLPLRLFGEEKKKHDMQKLKNKRKLSESVQVTESLLLFSTVKLL